MQNWKDTVTFDVMIMKLQNLPLLRHIFKFFVALPKLLSFDEYINNVSITSYGSTMVKIQLLSNI